MMAIDIQTVKDGKISKTYHMENWLSAIGQLLPLLDYVDMDGAMLIAKDIASGVHLEKGRAVFPDENGNGVRLLAPLS